MNIVVKDGITFTRSPRKNKKYMALYNDGKIIHFGDSRYQHYHDKIGLYSYLDHNDENRKRLYKARHKVKSKRSAGYLSMHYLW